MTLTDMIEEASAIAGSQRKLAELLEVDAASLIQMKQGKRPANWRVRGKLRVILGQDPAQAFVAAMAEDLSTSENEDEKKAAAGFEAMLAAFPSDWRKRMIAPLAALSLEVVSWLAGTVHSPLNDRLGNAVLQP